MSLAVWLLATAGTALILTQSTIVAPLREWLARFAETMSTQRVPVIGCLSQDFDIVNVVPSRGVRRWIAVMLGGFAKLVSCPMCSGFWLGLIWAVVLGTRGIVLLAHAFGGSIVSALGVATWLALGEAQAALSLWRYNHSPKDDS